MSLRVVPGGRVPDVAGRVPPHNLEAELQVIVHGVDNRRDVAVAVGMGLEPVHFYDPANARVWEAIATLAGSPDAVLNFATVHEWLRARDWLGKVGGEANLRRIADEIPRRGPMRVFVKIVRDLALVRAAQAEAHLIAAEGYVDVGEPAEWLEALPARMAKSTGGTRAKPPQSFAKSLATSWETLTSASGARAGYATGLEPYDAATGGLMPGEVLLVSAKEKAGKSMLVGQWFGSIAEPRVMLDEHDRPVRDAKGAIVYRRRACLIFALDSAKQGDWAERVAGARTMVDLERFRLGTANERDRQALAAGIEWANTLEVHVDGDEIGSVGQMGARIRALRDELEERGVDLVAVAIDYIQLAAGVGTNREEQIGSAMRGVVKLAGQEDLSAITWAVIAQTNNEGELTHCRALAKMADAWIHLSVDEDKPSESWWNDTAQGGEVVTSYPATITVNRSRRGAQGKRAKAIALWVCYRFAWFYAPPGDR